MSERRWYERPFRMFQTNLREIDAGLDVATTLDRIEAFGANTWLVNAGGILANHPSDLEAQTRNPALSQRPSGDLLGDAVEEGHRRGLRVLGRMDFSKVTRELAEAHPGWTYVSPRGEWQVYNGLVSVCPSGEYYQQRTFDILDELLDRYPLDGFFFNWFGFNEVDYSRVRHGVCHCAACRLGFREASSEPLPADTGAPTYLRWQRWTSEVLDDLVTRLRGHVAQRSPDIGVIGRAAQIIYHEANNAVGRPLWHHATSEGVSAAKAVRKDLPVVVNSVTFIDMPYRMAGEDPEHFMQYLVQAISRGGNPSTYIMGAPGDIPLACVEPAGAITRFHRDNVDLYDGLVSAARIAVVRQEATDVAAGVAADVRAEFQGIYRALQERHLPFDVLPQAALVATAAARGLDGYDLLVLPDVRTISTEQATVLDAFVEAGGALLATGSSGLREDDAMQLRSLGARERIARRDTEEALRASYVEIGGKGEPRWSTLPLYGAYDYVRLEDGATPHWRVLAPAPYGPPERCHGQRPTPHPGWIEAEHGAGVTAYVPWTVGRAYEQLGQREMRDHLIDVAEGLLAERRVLTADLPEQVEVVVGSAGQRRVVHLVNLSGATRSSFQVPVTIHGGALRFPDALGWTARARVAGLACRTEACGDDLVVHLPPLERFEVVELVPPDAVTKRSG